MINHGNNLAAELGKDWGPNHDAPASAKVVELARRVEQISHEINEFLMARFEALEHALRRRNADQAQRESSQRDAEALSHQRAQWEQEKRADVKKLEADRVSLAEAWERLETEQRKLLIDRAACERVPAMAETPGTSGNATTEVAPAAPHAVASQVAMSPSQVAHAKSANEDLEKAVRESVLMQFQQLKNDVRSHARRRNSR